MSVGGSARKLLILGSSRFKSAWEEFVRETTDSLFQGL